MINGCLNLKNKTAAEVMTRLEDVFMLSTKCILDFETVSNIQKKGYSRIPVYEGNDRKQVVALFHAKDLAFVDPNDNMPIKTLIEFYKHPVIEVEDDRTLDKVLNEFKEGKSHLAFVKQRFESDDSDPYFEVIFFVLIILSHHDDHSRRKSYAFADFFNASLPLSLSPLNVQIIGIVTLEDIIEEILQAEIVDETDTLSDNRCKRRRENVQLKDLSDFARIGGGSGGERMISPQMALAAFQFLSSSVDPFKDHLIRSNTLRKLMSQKIYFTIRIEEEADLDPSPSPSIPLYEEGKIADYFILIIEGKVRVTVGKESWFFIRALLRSLVSMHSRSEGEEEEEELETIRIQRLRDSSSLPISFRITHLT